MCSNPNLLFERMEAILVASFEDEPLEVYFWEQTDVPSSWNIYWTDAAREGGGLDIQDPVFGKNWMKYQGLHFCLFTDCGPEEACDCQGHNCIEAQSTVGHAAAAATTARSLGIPLIVVVFPTPTLSEIDVYNWHWKRCMICCHVRINGTPSSPGVTRGLRNHHGNHRLTEGCHRVR
jgi:hypothetical protein